MATAARLGRLPQRDVERIAADRGAAGNGGLVADEAEREHLAAVGTGLDLSLARS